MGRLEKKIVKKLPAVRYFLALYPPLELRRRISAVYSLFSKEARNFRFVEQEQMHVTVKFLGDDLCDNSLEQIITVLQQTIPQLTHPRLEITALRFGFPRQVIPRVLFFNIDNNPELDDLSKLVHKKITKLELPDVIRQKDFHKSIYHLTIARSKHHSSRNYGRSIRTMIKNIELESGLVFEAEKLYLIKSKIQSDSSPRYQILSEVPFKK